MKNIEKLKEIRKEQKLSQKEFSKKYGLKQNALKYVESGNQKFPDELAYALEKEYGIPFKWWKTGEGSMNVDTPTQEEAEYIKEVTETAEGLNIPTESLRQILRATAKEPELMSFAAKAAETGDQVSLERFYRLLKA